MQYKPEADVMREASRRYLAGETVDAIVADFNARGIPGAGYAKDPVTGKRAKDADGNYTNERCKWSARTLAGLLRNPALAGRRIDASGQTIHTYEGIITWDEHEQLVARLDSRAYRKGISPSNATLITGLFKCGQCGIRPMNRITAGANANRYPAYYCRSGRNGCRMLIPIADADEQARHQFLDVMGHHQWRIWETQAVANHRDEIDQLRQTVTS